MKADEQRLDAEIRDLLARAEDQDHADDTRLGAGVPETDLPGELSRREDRLARIRAAKAALEADARETRAAQLREQAERARTLAASSDDPAERERASRRAERREAAAHALVADGDGDDPSGSGPASGDAGGWWPVRHRGADHRRSRTDRHRDRGGQRLRAPGAPSEGDAPRHPAGECPAQLHGPGEPSGPGRLMERGGQFTQAYNGRRGTGTSRSTTSGT
jgi:hypothetical protein